MASIEQCKQPGVPQVDLLVKWHPRTTDIGALAARLGDDGSTRREMPREGKRLTPWEDSVQIADTLRLVRRVLRLSERSLNAQGQSLLVPEYELDGWTTSLPTGKFSSVGILALYADHATHEQFHSEFKTDLDLTRPLSGKFDTHYLVCQLAAVAMNILRLIGQRGLLGPDSPVRHEAKRRRIKTVIQELIYRTGRLINTGRKLILGLVLGANDRSAKAFARLHGELFAATT